VQLLLDAESEKINLDFDNQHYTIDSPDKNYKLIEKKMSRQVRVLLVLKITFINII
jgi:hypothetical protein